MENVECIVWFPMIHLVMSFLMCFWSCFGSKSPFLGVILKTFLSIMNVLQYRSKQMYSLLIYQQHPPGVSIAW